MLNGSQVRFGRFGNEKKIPSTSRESNQDSSAVQPLTYSLYWLHYVKSFVTLPPKSKDVRSGDPKCSRKWFSSLRPTTQHTSIRAVMKTQNVEVYNVIVRKARNFMNLTHKQWRRNSGSQVARATKFYTVAPTVCVSAVCNLLHVTLLAPRMLEWLLEFWKTWALPRIAQFRIVSKKALLVMASTWKRRTWYSEVAREAKKRFRREERTVGTYQIVKSQCYKHSTLEFLYRLILFQYGPIIWETSLAYILR